MSHILRQFKRFPLAFFPAFLSLIPPSAPLLSRSGSKKWRAGYTYKADPVLMYCCYRSRYYSIPCLSWPYHQCHSLPVWGILYNVYGQVTWAVHYMFWVRSILSDQCHSQPVLTWITWLVTCPEIDQVTCAVPYLSWLGLRDRFYLSWVGLSDPCRSVAVLSWVNGLVSDNIPKLGQVTCTIPSLS